ncbi:hypothetical protein [Flectobacillus roseus]|uniref:Lipoprotein n=2 Tax=Flectobacillus roseus TaxID=502259 RepID=A0ABT6YFE9_9BACT|nr:hypothetical protein [Flectobacillus roseus]MDI9862321.1 hypothetical protein [Flectobacillus roseus]
MKQVLTLLIILGFLLACTKHNSTEDKPSPALITQKKEADYYEQFLDLFEEIEPENLHIYTPDDSKNGDKFKGKVINQSFYKLLTFDDKFKFLLVDTTLHIYGCFRVKLSDTKTGLILRKPSQYDTESAIDLLIWDNSLKKVVGMYDLADSFGDEGWHFVQDAWLKDLNNDTKLDIVIRYRDIDYDLDDSSKVTQKDSLFAWLNMDKKFERTVFKFDTTKYKLHHWNP